MQPLRGRKTSFAGRCPGVRCATPGSDIPPLRGGRRLRYPDPRVAPFSFAQGSLPMRTFLLLLALAVAGLVVPPARAEQPAAVEAVKDIAYYDGKDADPIKHKLDLYLPKGKKDFPVLFFVHGGAWKSGDKKIYGRLGEVFARQGIGTVITNY